jgi:choline dehydrogenase-like flavoprotein
VPQPVYDVIVVGSGAAGGIASYVLATSGLNVLCLEAGRILDPAVDFYTHKFPYEWPYRGEGKPGQYGRLPQGMEWKIKEWTDHLYTIPEEDPYALAPGAKFTWTRLRAVGGRTNLWGRETERFGSLDFKPKSLQDGWGEDWPISYDDVAPYYDKVERLIGVSGDQHGGAYNSPQGEHQLPPFNARCGELLIKKGAAKLGIKAIPKAVAVLSQAYDGRPPCHFCGACGWGCDVRARFSSLDVIVPKLQGKPNFTLRTHAQAHTILMDPATGKARGVTYMDSQNKQEYEAYGKAVVLAASMIESIRILFNSRTRHFPAGLANSSGTLGHYLMEHVNADDVEGYLPQLLGRPTTNDDGPGGPSLYIPRYNFGDKSQKYLRGWRIYFGTGCGMDAGPGADLPGFGSAYKKKIKEIYPAQFSMGGYCEGLPFKRNYVEIDPDGLRDRLGIPQVRFHTHAEYPEAYAALHAMYDAIEEIVKASDGVLLPYKRLAPYPLGSVTHEAGGARMGHDPRTSVLDNWNRCHEVPNIVVADAACFVTHPEKPITHTIMALSYRAADHLAEEFRRGNVS